MYKFILSVLISLHAASLCLADAPLSASTVTIPNEITTTNLLTSYTATYKATWKAGWFPITVSATRTLKKSEDHDWTLSFEVYSSIADLSEISHFNLEGRVIKPQSYRYKTTGFLTKSTRSQDFNWPEKKIWLPKRNAWAEYELPDMLQDNITFQEQIRLELMAGNKKFEYPIAYKNRLKHYYFEVVGETQLHTKQGPITAVEVRQTHLKRKKESTRMWYAKDHDYLMLKLIKVKSNGDKHTILLKHAQLKDGPLQGF